MFFLVGHRSKIPDTAESHGITEDQFEIVEDYLRSMYEEQAELLVRLDSFIDDDCDGIQYNSLLWQLNKEIAPNRADYRFNPWKTINSGDVVRSWKRGREDLMDRAGFNSSTTQEVFSVFSGEKGLFGETQFRKQAFERGLSTRHIDIGREFIDWGQSSRSKLRDIERTGHWGYDDSRFASLPTLQEWVSGMSKKMIAGPSDVAA
jgi:hypothetical protein